MDLNRVTQIFSGRVEADGRRLFLGSGYLIGPGLVLTGAHVVLEAGASQVPSLVEVRVRTLGDLKEILPGFYEDSDDPTNPFASYREAIRRDGDRLRVAKLIWPKPGGKRPRLDMAVLAVQPTDALGAYEHVAPVPLAPLIEFTGSVECRSRGFPQWRQLQDAQKEWTIHRSFPTSGRFEEPDPQVMPEAELTLTEEGPPEAREWRGYSGASVIDTEGRIVAVVRSVEKSKTNRLLMVHLVPPYQADGGAKVDPTGFWNSINQVPDAGAANRSAPRPTQLSEYIHIVDRRLNDGLLESSCNARYACTSHSPAIVMFHGRNDDHMLVYPQRWRSGDLDYKRLTGDVIQTHTGHLNWPYAQTPQQQEKALADLKRQLAAFAIRAPGPGGRGDDAAGALSENDPPETFRKYFAALRLPRVLSVVLQAQRLKPPDLETFASFLNFMADAAAVKDVVSLFVGLMYLPDPGTDAEFLYLHPDAEPLSAHAQELWGALNRHACALGERVHVWRAGALTQVDHVDDIQDWRQRLARKGIQAPQAVFTRLTQQVGRTGTVPLLTFSELVAVSTGES